MRESFSVGLDIGTQAIKLVRLKIAKDAVFLSDFVIEKAEANPADTLKKIIQLKQIEKANISVCGPQSVIRYIAYPHMRQDELSQSLKFEAQEHLPFSLDTVNLDSAILKEGLPENKMSVLLAAVKKDFIAERLKILNEIGLKASTVNMDAIAIINAFDFNNSKSEEFTHKAVALLNVGSEFSTLSILDEGIPSFSRDIQLGGKRITQKIAESLSLDLKSAEAAKLAVDKKNTEKIQLAFESILTLLAQEIRTSFDFHENQRTSSVVKVYISGGSVKFPGFKDMLSNLLGIEVELWDPFSRITISPEVNLQELKDNAVQLAVSLGLALER